MPVRYLIALAGAAVLMAFVFGYRQGIVSVQQQLTEQALKQSEQARQKEKDMQKRLNGITENYLHEIDEYKKTINAYAANDFDVNRLSGARSCKAVPGDTADRSGVVCYTPAELQGKIRASLAIAAECDELALRYSALVKLYNEVGNDAEKTRNRR